MVNAIERETIYSQIEAGMCDSSLHIPVFNLLHVKSSDNDKLHIEVFCLIHVQKDCFESRLNNKFYLFGRVFGCFYWVSILLKLTQWTSFAFGILVAEQILHKQRISMHSESHKSLLITGAFLCPFKLLFSFTKGRVCKNSASGGLISQEDIGKAEYDCSRIIHYMLMLHHVLSNIFPEVGTKLRLKIWSLGCGSMPILKYPSPLQSEQNGWILIDGL